ncbi:MAG: transcription elongation factor GreB [Myxococcota bacterium]|jgi:transcription elongation factor GreB
MSATNYITPEGFERLRSELYELIHTERPAMVDQVAVAAAHGDRSENAEYIYGKKKLRAIDRRIKYLSGRINNMEVVQSPTELDGQIRFGAIVTVTDDDEETHEYRLVGADETDATLGYVSWQSPVGRALLGRRTGSFVEVRTPSGYREFYIEGFCYP